MLAVRERMLNIRLPKLGLDHFIDAALLFLLFMLFTFNHYLVGMSYLYYMSYFLFVGFSFVKVIMRIRLDGRVMISGVTAWYLAFSLYIVAATLWSDYPQMIIDTIIRLIQIVLLIFSISQTYATRSGVRRCLKIILWADFLCVLYIFASTPMNEWFLGNFGAEITGQNANTTGMVLTVSTLITAYFAYYEKQRLYYIIASVQFAAAILTSSRKTVVAVCIGFILLIFLKDKSFKLLIRMVVAAGIVCGIFYAMMNVPELYSAIGQRFESMLGYLMNTDKDNSMYMRGLFIDYARQFFFEHPILGSGAHSFSQMIVDVTGKSTYAHNNYYEVLANFGLVGFFIYYGMYAYLIIKLLRPVFRDGNSLAKLVFTLMVVILVCEYGIVLYYSVYAMVFITAVFMFISAYDLPRQPINGYQGNYLYTGTERTI